MNGKRTASESDEILTKRVKITESITDEKVSLTYSNEASSEWPVEPQSHGEPTFAAITEDTTDGTRLAFDDFGIECFDDAECDTTVNRQPVAGPMTWIQRQIELGTDPWYILQQLIPPNIILPEDMDTFTIWKLIFNILTEPQPRQKLSHINTIGQVLHLLTTCTNIVILTGAGVSVSCGIPDFRSQDGIYARLSKEYPDLPDPQAMFDIKYFRQNTKPFYKFAKEIYPGNFKPSLSHRFIHRVERNGQLLRNYTQNIDTLEKQTGITRAIECHGSFSTASCTSCKYRVTASMIRDDILNQVTPLCPKCPSSDDFLSVMKPDIVFFGESLPKKFHDCIEQDINQVDLLIVIGSSLKVRPVALIPNQIPSSVPQILINREPLPHLNFDVELLGDCDTTIGHICKQLGEPWSDVLQGYEVPKVSNECVLPFQKTFPDNDYYKKRPTGDCLQFIDDNQNTERNEDIDMWTEQKNNVENEDAPYIFLPPCRYIFHGAELRHPDSPSLSEDESAKTETSGEDSDNLDNDAVIDRGQSPPCSAEKHPIDNMMVNNNFTCKDYGSDSESSR